MLFIDGVGLGEVEPASNPLVRAEMPAVRGLLGGPLAGRLTVRRPGVVLVPADATLGMAGLPQSATNQTSLLTGINAARVVGRHVTAYPTAALRALLDGQSLFARVHAAGGRAVLANAFSPEYFAALAGRRLRMAAFTYAATSAGLPLCSVDDLLLGRSVFHDLTNSRLRRWGHGLPETTPRESGARLATIARDADLTVFEFFLTDLAAHGRTAILPDQAASMVDELLAGALDVADGSLTILLTSDHGNLEDGRTTAHTANPVPVLAIGPGCGAFGSVRSLLDVAPAILTLLCGGPT